MNSKAYWEWIRKNFPKEEGKVKWLWDERRELKARIEAIEKELLKYAPTDDD